MWLRPLRLKAANRLIPAAGAVVQIPRPVRDAIYKLIASERRRGDDAQKSRKDRAQTAFLFRVLAEGDPCALSDAWTTARANLRAWCTAPDGALAKRPEIDSLLRGLVCTVRRL